MSDLGIVILFRGAECRAYPFGDASGGIELSERLSQFCAALIADPDLSNCVAGLHGHEPGRCATR